MNTVRPKTTAGGGTRRRVGRKFCAVASVGTRRIAGREFCADMVRASIPPDRAWIQPLTCGGSPRHRSGNRPTRVMAARTGAGRGPERPPALQSLSMADGAAETAQRGRAGLFRRSRGRTGADGASAPVRLHYVLDPLGPRGRPGAGRTVPRRPDLVGLAPPLPALNHHPRPNQVTPGRGQRAPTPNPRRRPSPAGVGPHRGTGTAGLRLPARRARQANRALRPAIWTRAPAPGSHATQAPAGFPAGPSVRDGGHFTPHQRRDRGRRLRRDSPDRPIPYLAPAAYTPPPWNVSIS